MSVDDLEDLDDFGTDDEKEDQRPPKGGAAHVDSDSDDGDEEPAKTRATRGDTILVTPRRPASKRKRLSGTNDGTPKRSKITEGSEIEKNSLYSSNGDSLAKPQLARASAHRPHNPPKTPSSPFPTIDLDESETDSPTSPKHVRKPTVPKVIASPLGRNEKHTPGRSSKTNITSSLEFDLFVERRAARKASKHLEPNSTGEELRELQRNTPGPGPSSPSTSGRGSVESRGSSPSQPTPRLRPRSPSSTTISATEKKMIEAREELSTLALRFRHQLPRSSLGSEPSNTRMDDGKRANNDKTDTFDDSIYLLDETTYPFDENTHPFDESQTQAQEPYEDSNAPTQGPHPFDEITQQPPDSTLDDRTQHRGLEVGASDIKIADSPSAMPSAGLIMAGFKSLGFVPSEEDVYLGIQSVCEKIAKTHGFQSDTVFRVYHEVKDLRKAEEIVIGMKRAAEKDAFERIIKAREQAGNMKKSERSGGGSTYRDKDGGQGRTIRRSYGDGEDEDCGRRVADRSIVDEEDGVDPRSPTRVEHLSHRGKRPSTSSTSAVGQRG